MPPTAAVARPATRPVAQPAGSACAERRSPCTCGEPHRSAGDADDPVRPPARVRAAAPARRADDASLVGQLNREWDRLLADPASADACARWRQREPALAGLGGLAQIADRVAADPDAVLLALLRCAKAGLPLAARTVLQLMLPKAVRIARSQTGVDGREEAVAAAVAALWQAVACYPVQRRPVRVAANLAMETLAGTRRELAAARGQREATDLAGLSAEWLEAPDSAAGPARPCDLELHEALLRAVRQEVIGLAEARLLARVYGVAADGRPRDARIVAAQEGMSWPALRARCSRSTRRLAAARTSLAA